MKKGRLSVAVVVTASMIASLTTRSVSARDIGEKEKVELAASLTAALPAITVTYAGAPVIQGDVDPLVFKMVPSGRESFGKLFLSGRYDIIHRPDDTFNFGSYLCHLGQEFVRARRAQNAGVAMPKFDVTIPVKYRDIGFEIKGDQETAAEIVYGILLLWDWATQADYGRFSILIRGFADEGQQFVGQMAREHPIQSVVFLPRAQGQSEFYAPVPQQRTVGLSFSNEELPNLRATYLKGVIDAFLTTCGISGRYAEASTVLDGAVITEHNPGFRSVELFFYAVR